MNKAALSLLAACILFHQGVVHGQQGGVNIPVLPGVPNNPNPTTPDEYKDLITKSDLLMQRQLEMQIVESTRNPQHLLAFFNDFRAVDIAPVLEPTLPPQYQVARSGLRGILDRILAWFRGSERAPAPGLPRYAAAAEATIGMARSFDGGLTWTGALLPGSVDDTSLQSLQSPVYGLEAMTDPAGSPAPCGFAYIGFIAFTREGLSKVAVARYQDKNNVDGAETWVYQGTSVIETAKNSAQGQFHDLPVLRVDPSRGNASDPCAHNVYVGWARFNGADSASTLNFASTTAGSGANWNPVWATQFVTSTDKINQAVTIAIDPRPGTPATGGGGTVYYGWRSFKSQAQPDRFWITSSKNFGVTFEKPVIVTGTSDVYAYDQPTISSSLVPNPQFVTFRSNSLPTLAVVPNDPLNPTSSRVFMAWQERVNVAACPNAPCGLPDAAGDPRIVITHSIDGTTWSSRRAADIGNRDVLDPPPLGFGYLPQARPSGPQIMPRLTYGGGQLALLYYEARGGLTPVPPFGTVIAGWNRLIDARLAVLHPATGQSIGTSQVSRYPVKVGADLSNGEDLSDIAEVAPGVPAANLRLTHPMSGGGYTPFAGDYNDVRPIVTYVPGGPGEPWRWAIKPTDVPFQGFRTVFADSRNQIPPPLPTPELQLLAYPNYSPPGTNSPPCINPGSRNIDGLFALVRANVLINTSATFKQGNIERTFPVTLASGVGIQTFYRLTFDNSAIASWSQNDPNQDPKFDTLDVELFPYASSTRTAYISATSLTQSVTITVRALTSLGQQCTASTDCPVVGTVRLNLDPTNPPYEGSDSDVTTETHNPVVTNPVVTNPVVTNPVVTNPVVTNPVVTNPVVTNPVVTNPVVTNATIHDITDTTWAVQNEGNSGSAYVSLFNLGNLDTLSGNYAFQLLIYKTSQHAGLDGCNTVNVLHDQIISTVPNPVVTNPVVTNPVVTNPVVTNPVVTNPVVTNATFAESPSTLQTGDFHDGTRHDARRDQVYVTLRAYQLVANPPVKFDPDDNPPAFAAHAHASNVVQGVKMGLPPFAAKGSDLTVQGELPASVASQGYTLFIPQLSLRNDGNLKSGIFRHGYYLSTDPVIDSSDLLLAAGPTLRLHPGEFAAAGPTTVTIPSEVAPGTYYYGLLVDDLGNVGETDETNNYVSAVVLVRTPGAIDQQQPVIDAAAPPLTIGGPTAQKVAQTVTAGTTNSLTDVFMPVSCAAGVSLRLEIQGTAKSGMGAPDGVVRASITAPGPFTTPAGSFHNFILPTPLPMKKGDRFAIVLSATGGACSIAQGPAGGNPYSSGSAFSDSTAVTPGVWDALSRPDLPFKTGVK